MIISAIKVSGTYDSPLFLQTGAGHFTIRDLPTSTAISTTFSLNNGSNQNAPSDGSGNHKNGLSKPVLEYMFLAIVVVIIVCIIFRRLRRMRHQRELFSPVIINTRDYPSSSQRCRGYRGSRPVGLHSYEQSHPPNPDLPVFPAACHPRRRIYATDVDPGGRRTEDITVERDHDGELGVKDVLPPYNYFGGPPKYLELEMHSRNRPPFSGTIHGPDAGLDNTNDNSHNELHIGGLEPHSPTDWPAIR